MHYSFPYLSSKTTPPEKRYFWVPSSILWWHALVHHQVCLWHSLKDTELSSESWALKCMFALHRLYRKLHELPAERSAGGEGSEMWRNGRREKGALPPISRSFLPSPGSWSSSQTLMHLIQIYTAQFSCQCTILLQWYLRSVPLILGSSRSLISGSPHIPWCPCAHCLTLGWHI